MHLSRPRVLSLAFLPLVAVLTACGAGGTGTPSAPSSAASAPAAATSSPAPATSDAVDPDALVAAALAATKSASSAHVKGVVDDSGDKLTVDIAMTKAGDATAVVGNGTQGTVRLRIVGTQLYLGGDDAFWKAAGLPPKQMRDKWIRTARSTKDFAEFVQLTQLTSWADQIKPAGEVKVVAGKDFGGVATIGLDDGGDSVLYVAADGDHHPVALEPKNGTDGTLEFSGWNEPVTVTAPPAAQVVKV